MQTRHLSHSPSHSVSSTLSLQMSVTQSTLSACSCWNSISSSHCLSTRIVHWTVLDTTSPSGISCSSHQSHSWTHSVCLLSSVLYFPQSSTTRHGRLKPLTPGTSDSLKTADCGSLAHWSLDPCRTYWAWWWVWWIPSPSSPCRSTWQHHEGHTTRLRLQRLLWWWCPSHLRDRILAAR